MGDYGLLSPDAFYRGEIPLLFGGTDFGLTVEHFRHRQMRLRPEE